MMSTRWPATSYCACRSWRGRRARKERRSARTARISSSTACCICRATITNGEPTRLERLSAFLTREPEDRGELLDLLRSAFERRLLDADALSMIEGVLSVSETTVRDIMIPRAQMDCVSIDDEPPDFLPLILETKHSRF